MKLKGKIFYYQILPSGLYLGINEVKIDKTEILRLDCFILILSLVHKEIKLDSKNTSTSNSNSISLISKNKFAIEDM